MMHTVVTEMSFNSQLITLIFVSMNIFAVFQNKHYLKKENPNQQPFILAQVHSKNCFYL